MESLDRFRFVIDHELSLSAVHYVHHADGSLPMAGVELDFEGTLICIGVDPEDDSIRVHKSWEKAEELLREPVASLGWDTVYGRRILWAWSLTNHQGYEDGIQLEFSPIDGPYFSAQFCGCASSVTVLRLEEEPSSPQTERFHEAE